MIMVTTGSPATPGPAPAAGQTVPVRTAVDDMNQAPAAPTADATRPRAASNRRTAPAWWTRPPVMITGGLMLVIAEIAAFGLLGPLWWAVANAVVLLVVLALVFAWRRKGKGGWLAALASAWGRRPRALGGQGRNGGSPAGSRPGGAGRSAPGGGKSGPGRGPLAALRSKLPRALGGTGGGRGGSPAANRSGPGGRSNRPGGAGGGPLGLFRRRQPGADGGGTSPRRKRRGDQSGGGSPKGGGSATGKSGPGSSSGTKKPWWRRGPGRKGNATSKTTDHGLDKKDKSKPQKADVGKSGGADEKTKPTPAPKPPPAPKPAAGGTKPSNPSKPPAAPKPSGQRHAGPETAPSGGGSQMSSGDMQYADDQSLQRWGSNLKGAEPAAAEVQRLYAQAEAAKDRFNETFGKVRAQGETDLPTSDRLMADVQNIDHRARSAGTADEWSRITQDSAVLPETYRQEHEMDEARLDQPRRSQAAEKRADVSHAAQDR